jgi:hypothetical protein
MTFNLQRLIEFEHQSRIAHHVDRVESTIEDTVVANEHPVDQVVQVGRKDARKSTGNKPKRTLLASSFVQCKLDKTNHTCIGYTINKSITRYKS